MATVQSYTKSGIDAKFAARTPRVIPHNGGGTPDITSFPDAKTGDVIERSADGTRWRVLAGVLNPIENRVVSVNGKTGAAVLSPADVGAAPSSHTHPSAQISDATDSMHSGTGNRVLRQNADGWVLVHRDPTDDRHPTRKLYVDTKADSTLAAAKAYADSKTANAVTTWDALQGKPTTFPPSAHTHTLSQITDLPNEATATAKVSTVMIRSSEGKAEVEAPTQDKQIANKAYVDSKVSNAAVSWVNLSGKPATFPPDAHTHTQEDITDLPKSSQEATANTLAVRGTSGRLTVGTPSSTSDATTKAYVDSMFASNGSKWEDITGKPDTFPPSVHTHTMSQISDLPAVSKNSTENTIAVRDATGQLSVATPTALASAANKRYVDERTSWSGLSDKPETFPPSSHTHSLTDITGVPNTATSSNTKDTIMLRNALGQAQVSGPSSSLDIANKGYVDNYVTWVNITGKPTTFPPSTHKHTISEINDLTITSENTAGTVPTRDVNGRFKVANPSATSDVANKAYVDSKATWESISNKPEFSSETTGNTVAVRMGNGELRVSSPAFATISSITESTSAVNTRYLKEALTEVTSEINKAKPWVGTGTEYANIPSGSLDPNRLYVIV